MPSWKCTETLSEIKSSGECKYRYFHDKNKANNNIEKAIENNNFISYC